MNLCMSLCNSGYVVRILPGALHPSNCKWQFASLFSNLQYIYPKPTIQSIKTFAWAFERVVASCNIGIVISTFQEAYTTAIIAIQFHTFSGIFEKPLQDLCQIHTSELLDKSLDKPLQELLQVATNNMSSHYSLQQPLPFSQLPSLLRNLCRCISKPHLQSCPNYLTILCMSLCKSCCKLEQMIFNTPIATTITTFLKFWLCRSLHKSWCKLQTICPFNPLRSHCNSHHNFLQVPSLLTSPCRNWKYNSYLMYQKQIENTILVITGA